MKKIIKIIAVAVFVFLTSYNAQAQKGYAWRKLGGGINGGSGCSGSSTIQASKYINGNLYVSEFEQATGYVTIHKWNGTSWSKYPDFGYKGAGIRIMDIEICNGELYVCGRIDSISGIKRPNNKKMGIIKFNGTKWDTLPSYPKFVSRDSMDMVLSLKTFKGNLYYKLAYQYRDRIYSLNSSGITSIFIRADVLYQDFGRLDTIKNKLIIGGYFNKLNGVNTDGLVYYDGTSLTYTKYYKSNKLIYNYYVRNDSQYVVINYNNKIELWQNDSMLKDITPLTTFNYSDYTGITFYKNFIIATAGTKGNFYFDMDSSKWFKDNVSAEAIGISASQNKAFVSSCSNYLGAAELVQGALVTGKLYLDKDSSCTFNSGDIIIKNTLIEFTNSSQSFYTYSDNNGNYEISVLAGSYSVNYILPNTKSTIAPCSNIGVTVVAGTTTTGVGIPIHLSIYKNLGVSFSAYRGFATRRGFTEKYILTGTNYSFVKDSIILSLKYPKKVSFVSSDITPSSNSGNELIYKFSNVDRLETKKILIEFGTSVNTSSLGDTIKFYASVVNSKGDSLIINNYDTLCQKIVAGYDPNIKQCFPEGKVKPGLKKIKYVIHFQNTGTDTAFKVTVVDTITQKLGLRSVRVTGTSHPQSYSIRVDKNQTLIWDFNDIMLPDSHTNEKASHGFIAFEADINGALAVGDSITNKAYIYFDYNSAIITNQASVVVFKPIVSVNEINYLNTSNIKIFPNPSSNITNIIVDKKYANYTIKLYNVNGQLVNSNEINYLGESNINVANLPKGIYFVKVNGTDISGKLIVE